MATVYPYWALNPTQLQVNVSTGMSYIYCYLTLFSTPGFDSGTQVNWTLDSITISTDATINTPYQIGGWGEDSSKQFKTDVEPAFEEDTPYYHSYTIAGTQVTTGESFEFSTGVYNFTTGSSFPTPPYKVTNPGPEDNAININRVTNLTWDEGEETADDYDVWFGTPGNMVLVGTEITNKFFDIHDYSGGLNLDTEYEWQIDSYVNNELVATGDVWSYTTRAQRTVVLSAPTNGATGQLLPPFLIEWTIDGIGAQYGSEEDQDFLFIYMRKDDANFTEDNLIGNFVQAFYNNNLQIDALTTPVYGSTYYWQVQAGNTAADLADSEVWSFTMLDLLPPVVSGGATPTGENNMMTVKRLVAAARNKIFYEVL